MGTVLAIACLAAVAMPTTSAATYPEMKISEVHSDLNAGTADFIELQVWFYDPNFAGEQVSPSLRLYAPDGSTLKTLTFPSNTVATNQESQRTVLIRNAASAQPKDYGIAGLDPVSGGSVCFFATLVGELPIDCVAWGAVTSSPPSAGTPAGPLDGTHSLSRTLAPGCPTLLEGADDTDNSSVDFNPTTPSPRTNDTPPTETACAGMPALPGTTAPTAGSTSGGGKKKCKKGRKLRRGKCVKRKRR